MSGKFNALPSVTATLFALVCVSAATAQSPTGRAAVYACSAVETCSETGECSLIPATLFVVETFVTGNQAGPTYFAGPRDEGSVARLFFEQPVHPLHGATTVPDWFIRLPTILGSHLFARVPDPDANRYIHLRPASEVAELGGGRVITEFHCTQELFQ